MLIFADKLTLDKPRRTSDGYMAVRAKSARAGIYQYLGHEVDPDGVHFAADQVVNVYRPEEEVFDAASLGSFVGKPITDDHPGEAVNASNWRDLAGGTIMGAVRDGDYVGFDLAFFDAAIIDQLEAGKRELSNGYACKLDVEDGKAPDGTAYQAVQRTIRGNHVALVKAGRAGSECRVSDAKSCDPILSIALEKLLADGQTYNQNNSGDINDHKNSGNGDKPVPKLILIDGRQVDISDADAAEQVIRNLETKVADGAASLSTAQTALATSEASMAAKDAEIVALKAAVEDAKVTPAQLKDQAKAYAAICDKAKALGVEVADDADPAAIKKAVVAAKMGDTAANYTDAQIDAAFDVLSKDAKAATPTTDALANGLSAGPVSKSTGNRAAVTDARNARLSRLETSYIAGAPGSAN